LKEDARSKQTYVVDILKAGNAATWNGGPGKKDNCIIEPNDCFVDIEHSEGHMINVYVLLTLLSVLPLFVQRPQLLNCFVNSQFEGMDHLVRHISSHTPEVVTIRFKRKGVNQPAEKPKSTSGSLFPTNLKKVLSLSSNSQLSSLNQRAKEANASYLNQVKKVREFRVHYDDALTTILNSYQEAETERLSSISRNMKALLKTETSISSIWGDKTTQVSHVAGVLDHASLELTSLVDEIKSGRPPPPLPEYKIYTQSNPATAGDIRKEEAAPGAASEDGSEASSSEFEEAMMRYYDKMVDSVNGLEDVEMKRMQQWFKHTNGRDAFAAVLTRQRNTKQGVNVRLHPQAFRLLGTLVLSFLDQAKAAMHISAAQLVMIMSQSFYMEGDENTISSNSDGKSLAASLDSPTNASSHTRGNSSSGSSGDSKTTPSSSSTVGLMLSKPRRAGSNAIDRILEGGDEGNDDDDRDDNGDNEDDDWTHAVAVAKSSAASTGSNGSNNGNNNTNKFNLFAPVVPGTSVQPARAAGPLDPPALASPPLTSPPPIVAPTSSPSSSPLHQHQSLSTDNPSAFAPVSSSSSTCPSSTSTAFLPSSVVAAMPPTSLTVAINRSISTESLSSAPITPPLLSPSSTPPLMPSNSSMIVTVTTSNGNNSPQPGANRPSVTFHAGTRANGSNRTSFAIQTNSSGAPTLVRISSLPSASTLSNSSSGVSSSMTSTSTSTTSTTASSTLSSPMSNSLISPSLSSSTSVDSVSSISSNNNDRSSSPSPGLFTAPSPTASPSSSSSITSPAPTPVTTTRSHRSTVSSTSTPSVSQLPPSQQGRIFLQSIIKHHPVWKSSRFWEEAFFEALAKKMKKHRGNHRWLAESEQVEALRSQRNDVFSCLGTFAHNMREFDMERKQVISFVEKVGSINDMPEDELAMILAMDGLKDGTEPDMDGPLRTLVAHPMTMDDVSSVSIELSQRLQGTELVTFSLSLIIPHNDIDCDASAIGGDDFVKLSESPTGGYIRTPIVLFATGINSMSCLYCTLLFRHCSDHEPVGWLETDEEGALNWCRQGAPLTPNGCSLPFADITNISIGRHSSV
jgi:hypothetical protein